jgi:hypothetical protein
MQYLHHQYLQRQLLLYMQFPLQHLKRIQQNPRHQMILRLQKSGIHQRHHRLHPIHLAQFLHHHHPLQLQDIQLHKRLLLYYLV